MRKFLKIVGSLVVTVVIAVALFLYWPLHRTTTSPWTPCSSAAAS